MYTYLPVTDLSLYNIKDKNIKDKRHLCFNPIVLNVIFGL